MSSVRTADSRTPLLVPIDVAGLCVGANDAARATNGFAGATTAYDRQVSDRHAAYLGTNISRPFDFPPWDQLEAGMHLHWAIPDGLTRGGGPGAELDFPAVPDRWMVTRIAIVRGSVTQRSWLVESDALSTQAPASGTSSVTLPYQADPSEPQTFAYLGRSHDLKDGWDPARTASTVRVADATGRPLNVVTNGEVGFAAYYPSSRGVFGFWDDLADLTPLSSAPATLVYSVIGWYDRPDEDPVQPGMTAAELRGARGWSLDGDDASEPDCSVYAGALQGIDWSPETDYILGQPVQQPLTVSAAIGNTGAEALAAYFLGRDHPEVPLFETLLDAFQSGLIDTFKQPTPDGLSELRQRLHAQRYVGQQSGTVFSVVASDDDSPDPREIIDLPPGLAAALEHLNVVAGQADQCRLRADWYRWQLFADWYRIFMVDPGSVDEAYAVAQQRYGGWAELSDTLASLTAAAEKERSALVARLGPNMRLRSAPSARLLRPTDPAVVLSGPDLAFPERYGGDGRHREDGCLGCRVPEQLVTAVTVGQATLKATDLASVEAPNGLPDGQLLTALLRESCLLSTALMADLSGQPVDTLQAALDDALHGRPQKSYVIDGHLPSPVGIGWWRAGQFRPMFASWTVRYLPLKRTSVDQHPADYQPNIVNANFALDISGRLSYAPTGGEGSIDIDPRTAQFTGRYAGAGNLTPTPARTLADQLTSYLANHTDQTLSAVLSELTAGPGFLVAPLNGLMDQLVDRQPGVQLRIRVPADSEYAQLTQLVAEIASDAPRQGGPSFGNGQFSPLRAGYLKLELALVDVFGQVRQVQIPELVCAESLRAVIGGSAIPSVAYLQPRISQPARLAFHWLAPDGTDTELLTPDPPVSPVCGWLLPNHIDGSLGIYDQSGRPLGILQRRHTADGPAIGWQSAPGNNHTVNADLETVMAYQHPALRELVTALGNASAEFFAAMWRAIEASTANIEPGPAPTDSGLAALVGRPVAVAQAAVRFELDGAARLDLSFDRLGTDSDAGLTGIDFPVILGDLGRLGDGLIGYFTQHPSSPTEAAHGYDLTTFYCQAAPQGAGPGVVAPTQSTVVVNAAPAPSVDGEPPDPAHGTRHLLMLLDPRAPVHATTGALPTTALRLPTGLEATGPGSLDLALFTAPVLSGAGGLSIPTPSAPGSAVSFLDILPDDSGAMQWVVTADPPSPAPGISAFTPQQIREGWLRLNPTTLAFAITDADGRPVLRSGIANTATLTITNAAQHRVTFTPGKPVPEGSVGSGSLIYLHFGPLVADPDVEKIKLSAPGWAFQRFSSPQYGSYWSASPTTELTLPAAGQCRMTVEGLVVTPVGSRARVTFDYYDIDGLDDGVAFDMLTIAASTAPS